MAETLQLLSGVKRPPVTHAGIQPQKGTVMAHHDADIPTPVSSRNLSAGFEISAITAGECTLKVWGRLPPGWMGNLSSGLSRNHINIISATAKKENLTWSAEFEIMPDRFAADLDKIDFLALAMNGIDSDASVCFTLDELVFGEPDRNNGALYIEIKAPDQLGFLGAILNSLAFYSLFPETMIIETTNGRIFDRFWVKGIGGSTPSVTAINSLRQKLGSYLAQ
jgi:hypothetical protein